LGNTGENGIVPLLLPLVTESARDLALRKQVVRSLAQCKTVRPPCSNSPPNRSYRADLKLAASTTLNNVRWENLKAQAAQLLPLPARPGNNTIAADFGTGEVEGRSGKGRDPVPAAKPWAASSVIRSKVKGLISDRTFLRSARSWPPRKRSTNPSSTRAREFPLASRPGRSP